ncbi:lipoprotein [Halovulum dunhuangense]
MRAVLILALFALSACGIKGDPLPVSRAAQP